MHCMKKIFFNEKLIIILAHTRQYAIQAGSNVIDTSTNYELGESETMIGRVLNGMINELVIEREEVVVMSKIGYMQGPNLKEARERETQSKPYSQVSKLHPFHWHCIAPEFIGDQLEHSLNRLNLEQLDVLFLHNPEYCWNRNVCETVILSFFL